MTAPVEVSRPGLGTRMVTFYHDVIAEMKKVTWPDRQQLQQATIQIIIFVLLLGAVIALVDVALQALLVRLPALAQQPALDGAVRALPDGPARSELLALLASKLNPP